MKQTVKVQEVIILYMDIVRGEIAPPRKQVVTVGIIPDDQEYPDSFYESAFDQSVYYYFTESEWKEMKQRHYTGDELVGFGDNNFILAIVGEPEEVEIEYMEVA